MRSMIESYPEADRYWVVSGSELLGGTQPVHGIAASDPQIQALIRDYAGLRPLLPQKSQAAIDLGLPDLDLADIAAADKLVRRIKARYPTAKLGVELIFRGGQLRALDCRAAQRRLLDEHGELHGRDGDELLRRDPRTRPGRVAQDHRRRLRVEHPAQRDDVRPRRDHFRRRAYGLTGVLGQLNKSRGAEQSAQYIAEGAWNPDIRCQSFYERYLRRLYGPDALDALLKAFLLLEENEKTLGWHGRQGLLSTWAASSRMGVGLRTRQLQGREPLKLDRQEVEKAIQAAEAERQFWDGRAAHCRQALELMRQARPKVWPGSRDELDYVIYKTENFVTVFEMLGAVQEAKAAFDRALLAMKRWKARRPRPANNWSRAGRRWSGPTGWSGRPPSR